jgi:hypothetical protein
MIILLLSAYWPETRALAAIKIISITHGTAN